jgi:hypothetical protein
MSEDSFREDSFREVIPRCTICKRLFIGGIDYILWTEKVEGYILFYHDHCASSMVKRSAKAYDLRALTRDVVGPVERLTEHQYKRAHYSLRPMKLSRQVEIAELLLGRQIRGGDPVIELYECGVCGRELVDDSKWR